MSRYYKTMIRVTFSKIVKLEEALRTGALCIFMDIGRCQQEHFQRHISSRNKTKRTKSFYSGTGTSGLHGRHLVTQYLAIQMSGTKYRGAIPSQRTPDSNAKTFMYMSSPPFRGNFGTPVTPADTRTKLRIFNLQHAEEDARQRQ